MEVESIMDGSKRKARNTINDDSSFALFLLILSTKNDEKDKR